MKKDFSDDESLMIGEEADLIADDDTDTFESPEKANNKKRRLDDLLEEKRLRAEMDDYDDYSGKSKNYFADDYFDHVDRMRDVDDMYN